MNYKKNCSLFWKLIMGLAVFAFISPANHVQASEVMDQLSRGASIKPVPLNKTINRLAAQAATAGGITWRAINSLKAASLQVKSLQNSVSSIRPSMAAAAAASPASILQADEVASVARALNKDPLRICNFVYNNIKFSPYWGVKKGAAQTLIDRTGNDFDQAALLVALLRDSGYTANFVIGVLSMPRIGLANWLGVDPTFARIQAVLYQAGIPKGSVNTVDDTLEVERIWVQVTIDGTDYVFDPSYKQFDYKPGIDIAQATGYNQAGFLSAVNSGATINANYVQNLNQTNLRNKLSEYSSNYIFTIRNQYPNAEIKDIIGGRMIHQVQATSLQTSFPNVNHVNFSPVVWSSIPSNASYYTVISIQFNGLDVSVYSTDIIGKNFGILFAAIEGLSGVFPVLFLDGQIASDSSGNLLKGNSMSPGATSTMTITVSAPNFNPAVSTYPLTSGLTNVYAIVSEFGGGVGDAIIKKRQQVINELIANGYLNTSIRLACETLNVMGLTYIKEGQAAREIINQLAGTVPVYTDAYGVMARANGYYITARAGATSVSKHDDIDNSSAVRWSSTGFGNAYEGGIYDQMAGPNVHGISTVETFQLALNQGGKIYNLNSANLSSVLPLLNNYSADYLSAIQTRVNSGDTIYLPDNGAAGVNVVGPGYLAVNPNGTGIYALGTGGCGCGATTGTESIDIPAVVKTNQNVLLAVNETTTLTLKAAEPVDMTTGAYVQDHLDLALGQEAPLGLAFSRHYLSSSNFVSKTLGNGWTHNYDIRLTQQSNVNPALGFRSPVDAAGLISAAYIALDLIKTQNNLQGWVTASLVQQWASDQMTDNSVNVHLGPKVLTYVKLPDASFEPPPGITSKLLKNGNGTFSFKGRFDSAMNFDANSRVTDIADADGNSLSFTYSGDLLSKVSDPFGRSLNLAYNGNQLTSVTDSTNRAVSYGYDSNNNLTSYTDAAGKTWQYGYDDNHRLNSIINPLLTQVITNTYDAIGQVMTQVAPRQGGGTTTYNFYFTGVNNAVQNPLGKWTLYNLDDKGRTLSVVDPVGATSSVTYDGQNQVVSAADPLGNQTKFTYDGSNNLTNINDALSNNTIIAYDTLFHLTSVTDPLNHKTSFNYNTKHHLLRVVDPLSYVQGFDYFFNGFLKTATDPLNVTTTWFYDNYGNPSTVATAAHSVVSFSYDTVGRILSLRDQAGAVTGFQYDSRDLLSKKTDPLAHETIFTYDDIGRVVSAKDRNNQTITYAYTPTDSLDTITYPDTSKVQFAYDLDDRLISMTDSLGITSHTYDDAGRLNNYTNALGSIVAYTYDAADNVKSLTYQGNKVVTYTYDSLNRIKTVTNWLSQTATYTYDAAGRLQTFVNFNGTRANYTYDAADQLTGLAYTKSDTTPLFNYAFTLDGNGNRKQILQLEPLSTTVNLGTMGYTYNTSANRLLSLSGNAFTYDNEGQTTAQGASSYAFDYEHRLKSVGSAVTFSYNGNGDRLKAVRYGAEIHYIYDASGNLLAEADNTNTIIRYYIYGAGLLATVDAATGNAYCYHFNATGSTIALTNSAQAVVNKYAYTAYGVVTEQETVNQPFKYVGQYGVLAEPNGLYYMRARYYDPNVGRFLSEDPIGFAGGQVNLYAYVGNNPISFVDPLGLKCDGDDDNSGWWVGGFLGQGDAVRDFFKNFFVLGKAGRYDKVAKVLGASHFKVSDEIWEKLKKTGKAWSKNRKYIYDQLRSGKNPIFSDDPYDTASNPTFGKEVKYLQRRGLDVNNIPILDK